ncbi:hypothetical protein DES32_1883 [Methylovirgula ligni]|uniref:Uncharacterized protein n=1 Tax=Methylovirgula ligni TaxID=569860 RepID=A0A3D9YTA0_9HYPH|nr:hypothetical protein DES32_1883 [Methylovirgula ligni]
MFALPSIVCASSWHHESVFIAFSGKFAPFSSFGSAALWVGTLR